MFNQIIKLTVKSFGDLNNFHINYFMSLKVPMMRRQFRRK